MFNDNFLDKSYFYLSQEYPVLTQALFYHRTHKNKQIKFEKSLYLKAIYKDNSHHKVFRKGTQSCISEYLICLAINKAIKGNNVFYILPTDVVKARFVQSRFNTTIEYTSYYKSQMKDIDSASMKSFGGIINFVGSNSEANFGEFVAPVIIIDEKDYCNQTNLIMAKERQAKQEMEDRYTIEAGNPSTLGFGIDISFNNSDRKYWFNKCECGHSFYIDFFKHIVRKEDNDFIIIDKEFDIETDRDCNIICDKCNRAVNRFGDGEWVKEKKNEISGWQFSQFFTSPTPIRNQLQHFQRGLSNAKEMQRFYNAVLGLPYTAEGARISKNMLKEISHHYNLQDSSKNPCVCGIDIGNSITTIVGEIINIGDNTKIRIIFAQDLNNENDIVDINRRFNIVCGVIDMRPETRLSRRVVATFKRWFMIDYLTESAKDIIDENRKIFKTDRTTSLDELKASISLGFFQIPECLLNDDVFVSQIEASVRIWQEIDSHMEGGRYIWTEGSKADHRLHAWSYCYIAYKLIKMYKG